MLSFMILPVFAKTYNLTTKINFGMQTMVEDLKIGDIVLPGDKINIENWEQHNTTNTNITINYFEEDVEEATEYDSNYGVPTTNYYAEEINERNSVVEIKSRNIQGLNIKESIKNSSNKVIPFYGWKIARLKPSFYHFEYTIINLVPAYGYSHEIIKHPSIDDTTFLVDNADYVTDYYYASFDKNNNFSYFLQDNVTPNSVVNTDKLETKPDNIELDGNEITLKGISIDYNTQFPDDFEYPNFLGYFNLDGDEDLSITIDYVGMNNPYAYFYAI